MPLKRLNIVTIVIVLSLLGCKRIKDKPGCMDSEAFNYDPKATISVGTCMYPGIVNNPSFEQGWYYSSEYWSITGSGGYSHDVYYPGNPEGIMPTEGKMYLSCIPHVGFDTQLLGQVRANTHFKGFYFDYRYVAKAGLDSNLSAEVDFYVGDFKANNVSWARTVSENSTTFHGFPNIIVEKKDEFFALPHFNGGFIELHTSVSAGTFTFEMDNIRMVPD